MKLEVLGTGCKKCYELENNAKEALKNANLDAEVDHIIDVTEIIKRGIMKTPALTIDGKVVSQGKLLTSDEIQDLLIR
jgi:small redox-active disulfide protein 2